MKKYLFLLICLLIVDNVSATSALTNSSTRDTTNIPANPLDSLAECVNLVSGDSLWLTLLYPGGALAYVDSADWDDAQIKRVGCPNCPCSTYTWNDQLIDIDGAGVNGEYFYHIMIKDASLSLTTQYRGYKQIINSTLDAALDSSGVAALAAEQSLDSLGKIIDSLENQALWIAHQTTVDSLYDSLLVILDSLESASAHREELMDSIIIVIDSVNAMWDVNVETAHGLDGSTGLFLRILGKDLSNAVNDTSLYNQFKRLASLIFNL